MKAKALRASVLVLFTYVTFACSSDDGSTELEPPVLVSVYIYDTNELELMADINDYRVSKNLTPLESVAHISHISEEHNHYMMTNNLVNHDNFEQRAENLKRVLGALHVSENVAYGYSTIEGVLNAWIASTGHRSAIEGNFSHFGLSVSEHPETGKKYYTNIFVKI